MSKRSAAAATTAADNDSTDPTPGVVQTWPSATKAAQQAGVTTKRLMQVAAQGLVQRALAKDGTWRFNPDHLGELAGNESDDPAGVEPMKASGELVRQAQAHTEKLLAMVLEPSIRINALLAAENERLQKRCSELEQARLDAIGSLERILTEQHERDLATRALAAAEARKEAAFKMLMQNAPRLLQQLAGARAGVDAETQAKIDATIELLSNIDPLRLTALAESGFLTPTEQDAVRRIVAKPVTPATDFEHVEHVDGAPNGAMNGAKVAS